VRPITRILRAVQHLRRTACNNQSVISEMCLDDYRKVLGMAMYIERVEGK
jgi:hypothetical protein